MKLILPVDNTFPITLPFGAIYGPDIHGAGWNYSGRRHDGVDFGCSIGTQVRASADGRVSFCGLDKTGYGYLIRISHTDGSETRYAHLGLLLTTLNAYVYADQPIALSGDTGNVTGPHLHWEYRNANNKAVDPMEYVEKAAESANEKADSAINVGDNVVIAAPLVNIRDAAAGQIVGQLRQGLKAEVLTDAEKFNGLRWRKVRAEFWIAEADAEDTPLIMSV